MVVAGRKGMLTMGLSGLAARKRREGDGQSVDIRSGENADDVHFSHQWISLIVT